MLRPREVDPGDEAAAVADDELRDGSGQPGPGQHQPEPRLLRRARQTVGERRDRPGVPAVAPGQAEGRRTDGGQVDEPAGEEPVEVDDRAVQRVGPAQVQGGAQGRGDPGGPPGRHLLGRQGAAAQHDTLDRARAACRGDGAGHRVVRAGEVHTPEDRGGAPAHDGVPQQQPGHHLRADRVVGVQGRARVDVGVQPPPRRRPELGRREESRPHDRGPAERPAGQLRRAVRATGHGGMLPSTRSPAFPPSTGPARCAPSRPP